MVWRSRAAANQQRQQSRASYPQDRPNSGAHTGAQTGPTQPSAQSAQTDASKRVHFNQRPRYYKGKERGKESWGYLVDTMPDGTSQWVDEDPDEHAGDDDGYAL